MLSLPRLAHCLYGPLRSRFLGPAACSGTWDVRVLGSGQSADTAPRQLPCRRPFLCAPRDLAPDPIEKQRRKPGGRRAPHGARGGEARLGEVPSCRERLLRVSSAPDFARLSCRSAPSLPTTFHDECRFDVRPLFPPATQVMWMDCDSFFMDPGWDGLGCADTQWHRGVCWGTQGSGSQ